MLPRSGKADEYVDPCAAVGRVKTTLRGSYIFMDILQENAQKRVRTCPGGSGDLIIVI